MSRLTEDSPISGPSASTSQEDLESGARSASNRTLRVTLLSGEWRSTKGGLSTINRELAIQLAKHSNVEASMYLPQCTEEDERVAASHNVQLIKAKELIGYEPIDWLASLPENHHLDCIIGHGLPLGRQVQLIQRQYDCKWIQVVHTSPGDLGMFKGYADAISKGEKKHLAAIQLCELADQVVAVGPKLADKYSGCLRYCQKDQAVFKLTPSIFSEFSHVKQATEERAIFCVLVFGRGDDEDFELKGYDIAAKAIAELRENSYQLIFVGAPPGKEDGIAEKLCHHGIARTQLRVRSFKESREELVRLFFEVDLVIMPSRTEGFGLTALEALSAGLPVLVNGNSGLGDALKKVLHGSNCVLDSEDPKEWAKAIKNVREKDRDVRLGEAMDLRGKYAEKYSWEEQCGRLVEKMMEITFSSSERQAVETTSKRPSSPTAIASPKKPRLGTDVHEAGTVNSVVVKLLKAEYNRRAQLRPLLWDNTIQLPLENVYTRLKIVSRPKAGVLARDTELNADDISSSEDEGVAQAKGNQVDVHEIFAVPNKGEDVMALVEGSPGMGKTTFSLKLAYDWANDNTKATFNFPKFELVLLLKCRDIDGDIMESITEQLLPKDIEEKTREKLLDFIRDIHNQHKILIILDGLDELPEKSKHHVDELLHRRILPFCYILVTSRQERGIDARKSFVFDILLEIKGFTKSDAFEYVRKHFKNAGPGHSTKGERLIHEIKTNTFLYDLRKNPLNLLLLCVIFEDYEGELPSSRTKLYQIIVLCLLRRYCSKNNLEAPAKDRDLEEQFEKEILALGKLAWKCLLDDCHSFREDKLKKMEVRKKILLARGLGLLYKEESLKKLNPQHEYCFLHKTFQEYLAGSYIAHKLRRKNFNVFEQLSFDNLVGIYPQVFLFVSCLLGEEGSLLFEQIGKELVGNWNWHECNEESAGFFINSFSESENGEQMAVTLFSFVPFPVDIRLDNDGLGENFVFVLVACKQFSNVQKPINVIVDDISREDYLVTEEILESCSQLETLTITCEEMTKEFADILFERLSSSTCLSQLTLTVLQIGICDDIAVIIGRGLAASKTLTQVTLAFPGVFGQAFLSALDTGLSADTPLASAVLTVNGTMDKTTTQALENILSNKSLTYLSLVIRGDMQDLLARALSRELTGQISINALDLYVDGKLSCYGAKLLETGLLQNRSLNHLGVFVQGQLPRNWRTVVENVQSQGSFAFYTYIYRKVEADLVARFRPFAVEEGFGPKQHLTINVCGELTVEGADALCEALCPSLSRLTINLYGKLTDGVAHLSRRCINLRKTLSSITVNIWGKLSEEEKTLSQDVGKNPAITLTVHDVSVLPGDSSNDDNASIDNPASLATLFTEAKNAGREKLSLSINIKGDSTREDWADHLHDVLGEESALTELTLTINSDSLAGEEWGSGLGDGLRSNTSIRTLNLTVNIHGGLSDWEKGLGKGLKHNTTINALTLTINIYSRQTEFLGRDLGGCFAKNTALHAISLTINNYASTCQDWASQLGGGLAKSKSLVTCTLVFNMCGIVDPDYLPKLCKKLMRSKSLTTLTLQASDQLLPYGFLVDYDLSKVLVKSRSLTSIDLIVSFYGTESNTSDTSDTSDTSGTSE